MPKLIEKGIENRWNWRSLQKQFPVLEQTRAGWAFEDFFGSLVLACGGMSVAKQLTLLEGSTPRHEFDVIVSNGQKIVVFDFKLTRAEDDPVIDQFSRLAEDRRSLGGLGANAIAVRPSWEDDPVRTALARAHHVTLWTQRDMSHLVRKITESLQLPLPAPESPGGRASVLLQEAAKQVKRLFSSGALPRTPKTDPSMEPAVGWLALARFTSECFEGGAAMVVVDIGGRFVLRGSCERTGIDSSLALTKKTGDAVKIEIFKKSAKGFFAVAVPRAGGPVPLRERLTEMNAKSMKCALYRIAEITDSPRSIG